MQVPQEPSKSFTQLFIFWEYTFSVIISAKVGEWVPIHYISFDIFARETPWQMVIVYDINFKTRNWYLIASTILKNSIINQLHLSLVQVNAYQPSVTFQIETSLLICSASKMTDFYMKWNTGLKWFTLLCLNPTKWSNALKQLIGNSRRIVWVCLTILWGWCLKS